MTTRIVTGSKQEIARQVAAMEGNVREAIVFVEEVAIGPAGPVPATVDEMFKEMEPFSSQAEAPDFTRESVYTKKLGE